MRPGTLAYLRPVRKDKPPVIHEAAALDFARCGADLQKAVPIEAGAVTCRRCLVLRGEAPPPDYRKGLNRNLPR